MNSTQLLARQSNQKVATASTYCVNSPTSSLLRVSASIILCFFRSFPVHQQKVRCCSILLLPLQTFMQALGLKAPVLCMQRTKQSNGLLIWPKCLLVRAGYSLRAALRVICRHCWLLGGVGDIVPVALWTRFVHSSLLQAARTRP